MKLSEYKLLIKFMKEDKWYWESYLFTNPIFRKHFLKQLYKSLEFKSYLINYYLNKMKDFFIKSIEKMFGGIK